MSKPWIIWTLALLSSAFLAGSKAHAEEAGSEEKSEGEHEPNAKGDCDCGEDEEPENHYAERGLLEFGGSLTLRWTDTLLTVGVNPFVGWFIVDGLQLSLRFGIEYQRLKTSDGNRSSNATGNVLIEPSYHYPLTDSVHVFGGVGVGVVHDGEHAQFETEPRVGLNFAIGGSGVFTPALNLPILVGKNHGADNNHVGVSTGIGFQAGFSSTF